MSRRPTLLRSTAAILAGALGCASPAPIASDGAGGGAAGEPSTESAELDADDGVGMEYRDPQERFELAVPAGLVRLPEPSRLPERQPALIGRVRFQLRVLLGTDVVDLEPPPLTIEIFPGSTERLGTWLERHGWRSGRAKIETAEVPGAREALWLRDPAQLAPNENLWVAGSDALYRLVPVGDRGAAAAASFRLLP